MNHFRFQTLAATLAVCCAGPVAAHVDYADLDAFPTQTGSFETNGWFLGTDTPDTGCNIDGTPECLGNSHDVVYFKFSLSQASLVTITFAANATNSTGLDPAFSLYKGLFPFEAHDETTVDPQNSDGTHPTDGAYWDYNIQREGQFNALGTWSMANDDGEWGEITYITHVNANSATGPGAQESLINRLLAAGDYTIVAAGASTAPFAALRSGTLSLTVAPVPIPASFWLLSSALAGLAAARRKAIAQRT